MMVFQESLSSTFWFQPIWLCVLVLNILHLGGRGRGSLISEEELKDIPQVVIYISFEEELGL